MPWRKAIDFGLYSNLFISACAFALVAQTYLLLGEEVSWRVGGMLFFATLFLYNLDSLMPDRVRQPIPSTEKKKWLAQHRPVIQWFAAGAGVLVAGLFMTGNPVFPVWFLLHLLVISVLYTFPVVRRKYRFLPLRRVPLLKVFLIAYVWAALTVLLPLLYLGRDLFAPEHGWMFIRRFLFVFSLALLFDIRDQSRDKALGTYTFPVVMGIQFTKGFSLIVMFLFMALSLVQTAANESLALLLSGILSILVIVFAEEGKPEHYFVGLADGMMLLQFLLVWFFV